MARPTDAVRGRIICPRDTGKEMIVMRYANYSPQEVESRGEAIYEQQIRPSVEAANTGKFVVIDIESGEFEIDRDDLAATKRLLVKRRDAVLYGLRIGYPTAYTLGESVRRIGATHNLP